MGGFAGNEDGEADFAGAVETNGGIEAAPGTDGGNRTGRLGRQWLA
jgi:hypothetical protein